MAKCELVGGASTQSRGRRPLPPGAVRGRTLSAEGAMEEVEFEYEDGRRQTQRLLTWIGGQAGLLFGASRIPPSLGVSVPDTPGSYGHWWEYRLAEALGEVFDGHVTGQRLGARFFQNGGDACAAAARVARYATSCDAIATQGYHGAATDFAHEPAYNGYPVFALEKHRRFEFGDVDGLRQAARYAACIMVEVPAWDDEEAIAAFLRACRREADTLGIPFIIDDVVGGFRLGLAGTCERYGVKADLICLGKALSSTGGVSALIGNADLMKLLAEPVFYSTTFGGSPGACAVATETVRWLAAHRGVVYGAAGQLQTIGRALKEGFNARGIRCVGQPERSAFSFLSDSEWLRWCSGMIEQGVMVHRPNFPTLAHTLADVERTMEAVERVQAAEVKHGVTV